MKFSIVVPTYNEEADIAATLTCLTALDWPGREILVVDDSTDGTPGIVRRFADRGVRLIRPANSEGRCGARNAGILEATGEVIVILNADVHLPADFLTRIAAHYQRGADYVLVRSVVENLDDLYARYVECVSRVDYYGSLPLPIEWTEGFSCRRALAIEAGLFPTGYVVPLCAGEDGHFGAELRKLGAHRATDLGIVCTHVAPATLAAYWFTRKGRGRGSPQVRRFLQGWSHGRIALRAALRVIRTGGMAAALVPMLWVCHRYVSASPRGQRDLLPFCWAWLLEQVAFSVGEWESLIEIRRAERACAEAGDRGGVRE